MKLILKLLVAIIALAPALDAAAHGGPGPKPDRARQEWFAKMRQCKHDFLSDELQLSEKQKSEFFPVYDQMEDELMRTEGEVRHQAHQIRRKGDSATEEEINASIDAQYQLGSRLYAIEQKYLPQLKEILTPQQLFRLKDAERKFQNKLMEQLPKRGPKPPKDAPQP